MKYSYIIWDWNGTLLNDALICMKCVNDMLLKRDMRTIDLPEYRSYMDTPIIKFYEHLFDLSTISFDTIVKEFYESYDKYMETASLNQGSRELLDIFYKNGAKQIILSAANTEEIKKYVSKFGIAGYFADILGADNFKVKNKIGRAEKYFKRCEGAKLVIGDTVNDHEAASLLKADCILFSGGHQGEEELLKTCTPVVNSLKEIGSLIA